MYTIVIISSDSRVAVAVRPFEQMIAGRIISTGDFDSGLREVFEKRPSLVLIQEDIDGVSGETVAKHIKGLLQGESPRLVLLSKSSRSPASAGTFEEAVNISLPETEVRERLQHQFDALGKDVWREQAVETAVGGDVAVLPAFDTQNSELEQLLAAAPASAPQSAPIGLPAETISQPTRSAGKVQPLFPAEQPEPAARAPFDFPSAQGGSWGSTEVAPPRRVADPPPDTEWLKGIRARRVDPVPLAVPAPGGSWKGRAVIVLSAVLVLAIVGAGIYAALYTDLLRRLLPASPAPAPQVVAAPKPAVPSFIPLAGHDGSYRVANPGWDRYADASREYLVFRDKDVLKALQVIALKEGGIPDAFAAEAARATGGAAAVIAGRTEKNGYILENGKAGKADVLIYRKKDTGTIRALVITLG